MLSMDVSECVWFDECRAQAELRDGTVDHAYCECRPSLEEASSADSALSRVSCNDLGAIS